MAIFDPFDDLVSSPTPRDIRESTLNVERKRLGMKPEKKLKHVSVDPQLVAAATDRLDGGFDVAEPATPRTKTKTRTVADPTDVTANQRNLKLFIQHIPSGQTVQFKALIKEFSDSFTSNWNSEEVYGRMDPIETFQGTKRTIKLSWDVVSFDLTEAEDNLRDMDKLTNFLYPTYGSADGGATVITSSPLLRMKFANLITQPAGGSTVKSGLVGRMDGFSYTPDFDSGVFMAKGKNPKLFPQTINVSCTFYVLHTHKLGWRKNEGDRKFQSKAGFPHDMNPGAKKFAGKASTTAGKDAEAKKLDDPLAHAAGDDGGPRR